MEKTSKTVYAMYSDEIVKLIRAHFIQKFGTEDFKDANFKVQTFEMDDRENKPVISAELTVIEKAEDI